MSKNSVENLVPKFRSSRSYQFYMDWVAGPDGPRCSLAAREAIMAVVWYQRQTAGRYEFAPALSEQEKDRYLDPASGPCPISVERVASIKWSTISKYKQILARGHCTPNPTIRWVGLTAKWVRDQAVRDICSAARGLSKPRVANYGKRPMTMDRARSMADTSQLFLDAAFTGVFDDLCGYLIENQTVTIPLLSSWVVEYGRLYQDHQANGTPLSEESIVYFTMLAVHFMGIEAILFVLPYAELAEANETYSIVV